MKILHVLASVDPRAGGPVEGVRRSGVAMQDAGHEVEVATCDAPDDPYLAAFPFPVHAFGPTTNRYSYSAYLAPWLANHAKRFDAVVVHGLWQYHGFATWKALHDSGVPYYVYTHGMLDPWFKEAYPLKHLKKWLYWPWAEYRVLRDARAVIFTTEEERTRPASHSGSIALASASCRSEQRCPRSTQRRYAKRFCRQYPAHAANASCCFSAECTRKRL